MIGVHIVTDIGLYREGLARALEQAEGLRVLPTAGGPEPVESDRQQTVVLLDISRDGVAGVADLLATNPGLWIVALGVAGDEAEIVAYAQAGIAGYVTRENSIADLVRTIHSVADGELQCAPRIAAALIRKVAMLSAENHASILRVHLSRRELEILDLIDDGLSNKEIARRLFISLATAKNHVHNILDKLDVGSRGEAAAWARRQRLDDSTRPPAAVRSTAAAADRFGRDDRPF